MKKDLTAKQSNELIETLKTRFEKNMKRHQGLKWGDVEKKLNTAGAKLRSLFEMEQTGGEPDATGYDAKTKEYIFTDCSAESPAGRRSLCYDEDALESRKQNKPAGSAMSMAAEMGIEMLTEEQYFELQKLGRFDTKTSSWLKTAAELRQHGGAIFGDCRYERVFIYHNGAESYYAARGFRGRIRI
ncbi:MAG: hypothetical protein AMXMBFR48_28950 [Ignavibacteriales bacterium]